MKPVDTVTFVPDRGWIAKKRVAVVAALFNPAICDGLLRGASSALEEMGLPPDRTEVFRVPGAFEIPLAARKAAGSGRFDGVIALGCVIRGETPHFEYVSLAATEGCLRAGLDSGRPVSFGVLTVNNVAQARARSGNDGDNKGREAAVSLLSVLKTLERI